MEQKRAVNVETIRNMCICLGMRYRVVVLVLANCPMLYLDTDVESLDVAVVFSALTLLVRLRRDNQP